MTHKLVYWDNPWLRKKAEVHTELNDTSRAFAQELMEIVTTKKLDSKTSFTIGLAATQVQSNHRMFIVRPYLGNEHQERFGEAKLFINPVLTDPSEEMEIEDEGCLSFPSYYVPVARPISITVSYQDIEGKEFKERLHGFYARQVMHENDHLNGVLMIDRVSKTLRKRIKNQLNSLRKKWQKLD